MKDSRKINVWPLQMAAGVAFMFVIVALCYWRSSMLAEREEARHWRQMVPHLDLTSQKVRSRCDELREKLAQRADSPLICREGENLRGATLNRDSFRLASFKDSDLHGAKLVGGVSSFQGARFDNARLSNCTLTGGASSFQGASFVNSDLSSSVLTGNFQCASFEHATLRGAHIVALTAVDFQGVKLDGAAFQQADLSTIAAGALKSCYFTGAPPSYDRETKFPQGFNPTMYGWVRVEG